jgi:hypothetical protein
MSHYFSDISPWWILPLLIVSAALAWFYYKRSGDWTKKQRSLLTALRAIGLTLLFLLLIGLVWESIDYREEKPLFITLVDQSESMTNYSDSGNVRKQIDGFRNALGDKFGDRFELLTLNVGQAVSPYAKTELNQKQTDLAAGFDHIRELYYNRNIGGVAIISDGNFNSGTHPMYSAERLEITPVFALGAGDTVTRRDQVMKSVSSNEVAFLNNQFPIEATVDFNRIPVGPARVVLSNNGNQVAAQTVNCTNAVFDQQNVSFIVDAKVKGFQRYTVTVESKPGEFSYANNSQSCYIEIIDNKNLICLLSSAPHPDLAAIRSVLEEDRQTTIVTSLTSNFSMPKERPNLVIWYENGSKPNAALFNDLRSKNIPVFLIVGPTTPSTVIRSYNFGLMMPSGSQQDEVQASVSPGFSAFSFTTAFTDALQYYPPLRTRFGKFGLPANAKIMLTQRIGQIAKNEPLLYIADNDKSKIGVLLGEGIWRWKIREFGQRKSIEGFRELIQKTVQYLVVQQNTDPLRVTLPGRFTVAEDVEVKAEFYNEAMELITAPEIKLTLVSGRETNTLGFSPLSNFYKVNAGQLKPGTYKWTVSASYKGKKYVKSGEFVVEDISLEKTSTRADFSVLNQLARQSDGSFHRLSDYNSLLQELEKRSDIAPVRFEDSGYTALIDWKWIFVFLILVFGTEWFLRRWWGNY